MTTEAGMVLTTCSTPEMGKRLAEGLLEQKLAACIQMLPIHSAYRWKGAIQHESETLLLIKTKASLYPGVEAYIRKNHEYEVPEIILVPVAAGLSAYLRWIGEETQGAG